MTCWFRGSHSTFLLKHTTVFTQVLSPPSEIQDIAYVYFFYFSISVVGQILSFYPIHKVLCFLILICSSPPVLWLLKFILKYFNKILVIFFSRYLISAYEKEIKHERCKTRSHPHPEVLSCAFSRKVHFLSSP